MRIVLLIVPAVLAMLLGGCATTQRRTYSVSVVNAAREPVVLWLTKDGPPMEEQWLTPSQWHELRWRGTIPADIPDPAVELPPGMKVDLGPQRGRFDPGTGAALLVYSTPVTLAEMADTPRRSALLDIVLLEPGHNNVMVRSSSPVRAERVVRLEGRPAGAPEGRS